MKSIKDEKNSVLPRREIIFELNHASKPTPTNETVKEEISKTLKCNKELMVIKKIDTHFGSTISHVKVYLYDNLKEMKILERIKEEPKKEESSESKLTEEKSEEVKEKPSEERVEKK